jgi:hypothetical protein
MTSLLVRYNGRLWQSAIDLAVATTGYNYGPKNPLPDGTAFACGGAIWTPPPLRPKRKKSRQGDGIVQFPEEGDPELNEPNEHEPEKEETCQFVVVPEGAMEWLLHEVGHWVAATPEERARPNYGLSPSEVGDDGDREWQAWAFEEMIFAPMGPARSFAPPTQRDGAAFTKSGPIPERYFQHVERQNRDIGLDLESWRSVWGEWVRWGQTMGAAAPWISAT